MPHRRHKLPLGAPQTAYNMAQRPAIEGEATLTYRGLHSIHFVSLLLLPLWRGVRGLHLARHCPLLRHGHLLKLMAQEDGRLQSEMSQHGIVGANAGEPGHTWRSSCATASSTSFSTSRSFSSWTSLTVTHETSVASTWQTPAPPEGQHTSQVPENT